MNFKHIYVLCCKSRLAKFEKKEKNLRLKEKTLSNEMK